MGGLSGLIYDWTGSYIAALVNGIAWNLTKMAIAFWLLQRKRRRAVVVAAELRRRNVLAKASWQAQHKIRAECLDRSNQAQCSRERTDSGGDFQGAIRREVVRVRCG